MIESGSLVAALRNGEIKNGPLCAMTFASREQCERDVDPSYLTEKHKIAWNSDLRVLARSVGEQKERGDA